MAENPTGPNPEQQPPEDHAETPSAANLAHTGFETAFTAGWHAAGVKPNAEPVPEPAAATEGPIPDPETTEPATEPAAESPETDDSAKTAETFARQVELYKANLQRKFGQKALETSVSTMAFAANIPGLKDIGGFLRGARTVLGTVSMGMLGGDLGRQLGLSKFSAEQGRKTAEFLERTKQFYNPDGTLRELTADEQLAIEGLRTELTKQLELSAAVAKTTEHHKLFGRLIEDDIDKTAPESKGWLKEMASGIRSIFTKDTAKKALGLAGKVTPRAVASASWSIAKAGARNWKALAWAGAPFGAMWLAPAAAPFILGGSVGVNLYRKGAQLRELYKAHGEAEERVRSYQTFSFKGVESVNNLADQLIKLDAALGRGEAGVTTEQLLQQLNGSINEDTYRDIAKAVRQAAAAGAGAGFAAGAAMYTLFGHRHEEASSTDAAASAGTERDIASPGQHGIEAPHDPHTIAAPHDPSDITAPGPKDIPAPLPQDIAPPTEHGNIPAPKPFGVDIPAPMPHDAELPSGIPEHLHQGDHLKLDLHGDGRLTDFQVEKDDAGRLFIKLNEMDHGDGINHHIKLTPDELKRGVAGKHVKVFIDRPTPNGGYMGLEMEVLKNGKEQAGQVMWVGDKDDWMRHQVGEQNWNQVREHAKNSIGADHHDTKGWGFVARHAPPASIDDGRSLDGLQGKELEQAVADKVPEAQISGYDKATDTFSGTWLGKHGFAVEFTNGNKLGQEEIDKFLEGWPPDQRLTVEQELQQFLHNDGSYAFARFTIPADRLDSFSKALVYHPAGLPGALKRALREIHSQRPVASEALLNALKGKKQFTLEQLLQAARQARQAAAARKG